jgi:peroxiredoxin
VQPRITLCSVCHSQMPAGQSYCKNCGSTLCPHCRELLPQRSRFCPKCGFLCVAEQQILTPPVKPPVSARPQAMPVPRPAMAVSQPALAPIPQQSFGSPAALHQRNCPKCGASIDYELGRCTGCGLLYGVKHRVIQQAAAMPAAPIPRPPASWPQSSMGQQPPAAFNAMPQYNSPRHSVPPPTSGQHPNYTPAVAMPQAGMLMPIPRIAPAVPGGMSPSAPVPPRPDQYHAAPPASTERRAPASRKGGLPGFVTTLIIIFVCFLFGSGVYYFTNRTGTTSTPDNAVSNSTLTMQPPPIPVGTQVGNRAPDFTLQDLNGKDVKLSDFRGKIVMINFWATWCVPCINELPFMQAISDNWSSKGIQVLAIAIKDHEQLDAVGQYITQNTYTFRVLWDSKGQAESLYNVSTFPTTFFIDKEGIIKKIQVGSFEDQSAIESILNSL